IFKDQGFKDTVIGFEAIGTTAGTGVSLLVNLSATTPTSVTDADFALQADITFERTTLRSGQVATKISATNVTASFGAINFAATGNALILITPAGISANIDVTLSAVSFSDGSNTFALASPTFRLEINTATTSVNQEFKVAAYTDSSGATQTTRTLILPAGKFVRITGENLGLKIDLGNNTGTIGSSDQPEIEFGGSISIAQVTDVSDPGSPKKRTIFAFTGVYGTYRDTVSNDVFSLKDGKGVIIYYDDGAAASQNGLAGQIEVTAQGGSGDFAAEATGVLRLNTTTRTNIDQSVTISDAVYRLTFGAGEGDFVQLGIVDVTLTYDPYLTITGSVNTLNLDDPLLANFKSAGATSGIVGR
ncbi:hypothetical protein LCGC14_3026250, partial [marine sediment metagenome]